MFCGLTELNLYREFNWQGQKIVSGDFRKLWQAFIQQIEREIF